MRRAADYVTLCCPTSGCRAFTVALDFADPLMQAGGVDLQMPDGTTRWHEEVNAHERRCQEKKDAEVAKRLFEDQMEKEIDWEAKFDGGIQTRRGRVAGKSPGKALGLGSAKKKQVKGKGKAIVQGSVKDSSPPPPAVGTANRPERGGCSGGRCGQDDGGCGGGGGRTDGCNEGLPNCEMEPAPSDEDMPDLPESTDVKGFHDSALCAEKSATCTPSLELIPLDSHTAGNAI